MRNYIQQVRSAIAASIEVEDDLLDLYTLVALLKGKETTLKDIHDAWAVWRNKTVPEHRSLIPFEKLSSEVQELDRPYMEAVRSACV